MKENESSYLDKNSILMEEEEENDLNKSEIKDFPDIINNFKFCINSWGNFIIEPDLYYQNQYYFFDLDDFKQKLLKNLDDILNKYPYMFEPYKEDLLRYTQNLENIPFQRRPYKFGEKIRRRIHYLKYPNDKNTIEKKKAIILATIIHKINLNNFLNNNENDCYIGYIDYIPLGTDINFIYNPYFKSINNEIKAIDYYYNDNDTYIEFLSKKMKSIKYNIELIFKEKKINIF